MVDVRGSRILVIALTSFICVGHLSAEDVVPCPLAHAHNDYLHGRPLLDALDNGFCSVEADVFLVDGKLLVAHTRFGLNPERTLRSLYLDPLRERVKKNGGSVYGDGQVLTLLIDIKSDAEATYRALDALLAEYPEVFTHLENAQVNDRAVTAIVSGNRAIDGITADSSRYVGLDGRLSDLESDQPAHLLPLISDHWGNHFRWRGVGEMNAEDRQKLKNVIEKAHQKNRRVRFWAAPDNAQGWAALKEAGVDLINTDDLPGLSQFLRAAK